MDLKIRKAVDDWNRHKEVFEMNFGTKTWYHIHRNNIVFLGERETRKQQGTLFNMLYIGLIAVVKGNYNRAAKKLTLKL